MEVLTYTERNVTILDANFKEFSIFSRKIPQHPAAPYHSSSPIIVRVYSSIKGVLAQFPFPLLIQYDGHSLTKNMLERNILQEGY
jgi:hypothetical protein